MTAQPEKERQPEILTLPAGTCLHRGPNHDSFCGLAEPSVSLTVTGRQNDWTRGTVQVGRDPRSGQPIFETYYIASISQDGPATIIETGERTWVGKDIVSITGLKKEQVWGIMPVIDRMVGRQEKDEVSGELVGKKLLFLDTVADGSVTLPFALAARALGCSSLTEMTALPAYYDLGEKELVEEILAENQADLVIMRTGSTFPSIYTSQCHPSIINAGQGEEDLVMGLRDLYSVWKFHKRLDGLRALAAGNLSHGFLPFLKLLGVVGASGRGASKISLTCAAPPRLSLPYSLKESLDRAGLAVRETSSLNRNMISDSDVVCFCDETNEGEREEIKQRFSQWEERIRDHATPRILVLKSGPRVYDFSLATRMAVLAAVVGEA